MLTGKLPPVPKPPSSKNSASTHSKIPPASGQNGERSTSSSLCFRVCLRLRAILPLDYITLRHKRYYKPNYSKNYNSCQRTVSRTGAAMGGLKRFLLGS